MKIHVYVTRISPKPKKEIAKLLQFQKILEQTEVFSFVFSSFFLMQIFQIKILVFKYGFRKLTLSTSRKKKVIAYIYYVQPQVDY